MKTNKNLDSQQRFGIRKLTVGVCSVLLSTICFGVGIAQQPSIVHADEQSVQLQSKQLPDDEASQKVKNNDPADMAGEQIQAKGEKKEENSESTDSNQDIQKSTFGNQQDKNNSEKEEKPKTSGDAVTPDSLQGNTPDDKNKNSDGAAPHKRINQTEFRKVEPANNGTVNNISDTEQTREAIVKYIDAENGQSLAPDAIVKTYYKRDKNADGTYGVWNWDTSKGDSKNPGYTVIQGKWTSLPEDWKNVVADVPTISGYTAQTEGDWEHLPGESNISTVKTNVFVHPTYTHGGISHVGTENSIAYTDNGDNYESLPIHIVYYWHDKQATETINIIDSQSKKVVSTTNKKIDLTGNYSEKTHSVTYTASIESQKAIIPQDYGVYKVVYPNGTVDTDFTSFSHDHDAYTNGGAGYINLNAITMDNIPSNKDLKLNINIYAGKKATVTINYWDDTVKDKNTGKSELITSTTIGNSEMDLNHGSPDYDKYSYGIPVGAHLNLFKDINWSYSDYGYVLTNQDDFNTYSNYLVANSTNTVNIHLKHKIDAIYNYEGDINRTDVAKINMYQYMQEVLNNEHVDAMPPYVGGYTYNLKTGKWELNSSEPESLDLPINAVFNNYDHVTNKGTLVSLSVGNYKFNNNWDNPDLINDDGKSIYSLLKPAKLFDLIPKGYHTILTYSGNGYEYKRGEGPVDIDGMINPIDLVLPRSQLKRALKDNTVPTILDDTEQVSVAVVPDEITNKVIIKDDTTNKIIASYKVNGYTDLRIYLDPNNINNDLLEYIKDQLKQDNLHGDTYYSSTEQAVKPVLYQHGYYDVNIDSNPIKVPEENNFDIYNFEGYQSYWMRETEEKVRKETDYSKAYYFIGPYDYGINATPYDDTKNVIKLFEILNNIHNRNQASEKVIGTNTLYKNYNVGAIPDAVYIMEPGKDWVLHLTHKTEPTADTTKEITRTIIVDKPDGTKSIIKQPVKLTGKGTKDLVTDEITYKWNTGIWDAYTAPIIAGYTADPISIAKVTVTSDMSDTTVTVTYVANYNGGNDDGDDKKDKTLPEKPRDDNQGKATENVSGDSNTNGDTKKKSNKLERKTDSKSRKSSRVSQTKKKNEHNKRTEVAPKADIKANKGNKTGTISPKSVIAANATKSATVVNTGVKNDNAMTESKKSQILPQTGETESKATVIIAGLLAVGIGMFALASDRKRDNK